MMKKTVILILAALLLSLSAAAQKTSCYVGIQGGATVDKLSTAVEQFRGKALPGWHAGVTCELKLPAYFSLQPAVNFEQGRSQFLLEGYTSDPAVTKINYINIPVALQWGPDLGLLRFYAQVAPYVDCFVGGKYRSPDADVWAGIKEYLGKAQFGVGVGAGVEIWRIQLSARYNWGLGEWKGIATQNPFDLMNKRRGVTVTLAYMFN